MSPRSRRVALGLMGLGVLWFGSAALLERSSAFWRMADEEAQAPQEQALRVEADLRRLAELSARMAPAADGEDETLDEGESSHDMILFVGTSAVASDLDLDLIAEGLSVDREQVEGLSLPAANAVELAMLTPDMAALEPRAVVFMAGVTTLYRKIDVSRVRIYDAEFALRLWGVAGLAEDHEAHAAQMLAQQHVVLRQRGPLRSILRRKLMERAPFVRSEKPTLFSRELPATVDAAFNGSEQDFACDSIQLVALAKMASDLGAAGARFVVIATPTVTPRASDPRLRARLDDCLEPLAEREGFEYVPHAVVPHFAPGDFDRDAMHMKAGAREIFSRFVVEQLRSSP